MRYVKVKEGGLIYELPLQMLSLFAEAKKNNELVKFQKYIINGKKSN